jgi:hypothetical protein
MHARRQLSHRLVALALVLTLGCVSDRYVGSIGPDSVYSNRGYGFALRTNADTFADRWRVIDPRNTKDVPIAKRPVIHDEPIDVNGDAELRIGETTHFFVPTLRFLSKTSTGAEITVDVEILGGKARTYPLDELVIPEVRHLTKTASITGTIEKRTVSGYEARLAETPPDAEGKAYRIVVVDHADFIAEQETTRRQLIKVELVAHEITDTMRKDLDLLIDALYLNHHAGQETSQEKW